MYPQNSPSLSPFSQHTPQQGSTQQASPGMDMSKALPQHHHSHRQAELLDDDIIPFHDSPGVPGQQSVRPKTMHPHVDLRVLPLPEPGTPPQLVPDASGAAWPPQQQSPAWPQASPASQGHHGHQDPLHLEDLYEDFMDFRLSLQEGQDLQVSPTVPLGQQTPGAPSPSERDQRVPQEPWPVSPVCQVPQVGLPALPADSGPSAAGPSQGRRPSTRPRRQKLYECSKFTDPAKEKRRQDAINSKKNRDHRKKSMEELRSRVKSATLLRDNLREQVAGLKEREAKLLAQLRALPNTLPCPLPITYPDTLPPTTTLSPTYTPPDTLPPTTTLAPTYTMPPTTTPPTYTLPDTYPDTFPPTATTLNTLPLTTTMPNILPGTTTMPNTLSGTTTMSNTLPGTTTMSNTLPGTTTMPNTLPGTTTMPNTLPSTTTVPNTLPGAITMPNTLPGTTMMPNTLPGTITLPNTLPGTTTMSNILPGTTTMPNTLPNTNTLSPTYTLPPIYTLPAFSVLRQDSEDPYNMDTQTYPADQW